MEKEYASKGVAGAGLGTGIAGLSLGVLNTLGNGTGLLGWGRNATIVDHGSCCVNRFELEQQNQITNRDMEIAYLKGRDAAKSDSLELYRYLDGRFREVEQRLCEQAVINERVTQVLSCTKQQLDTLSALVSSFTSTKLRTDMLCPPVTTSTTQG